MRNTPITISFNADGSDPLTTTYGQLLHIVRVRLQIDPEGVIYIVTPRAQYPYKLRHLYDAIHAAVNGVPQPARAHVAQPQQASAHAFDNDPILDTEL